MSPQDTWHLPAGKGRLLSGHWQGWPHCLLGGWEAEEGGGGPSAWRTGGRHCRRTAPHGQGTGSQSRRLWSREGRLPPGQRGLCSPHTQVPGSRLSGLPAHQGPQEEPVGSPGPQAQMRPVGVSCQWMDSGGHPRAPLGSQLRPRLSSLAEVCPFRGRGPRRKGKGQVQVTRGRGLGWDRGVGRLWGPPFGFSCV